MTPGAQVVVWVLWAVDATVVTVLARRFLADWHNRAEDRVLVTLGAIIVGVAVALSAGIAVLQFGVLT